METTTDNVIQLDPSGDRRALVGAGECQKTVVVSSKALSLASPVWRAMLHPRNGVWKESLVDAEISFADDDPEACMTLLYITHFQFSKLPQFMDFHQILNIAILCDKYDTVSLVRPWLDKWQAKSLASAGKPGYEKYLFIAWVVGNAELFNKIANRLVHELSVGEQGQCVNSLGEAIENNMPPGLVECVQKEREAAIAQLLCYCYDLVDNFEESNCQTRDARSECNALVIGSRILALKKVNLWPRRVDASAITMSLTAFADQLLEFSFLALPPNDRRYGYDKDPHGNCHRTEEFRAKVRATLKSMPNVVQESHKKHLAVQAQK